MLLQLECFVLCVGHRDHKRTLVNFIGYSLLRISWHVQPVELVEEGNQIVALQSVIDGHDTDASLLQKLYVGARYIAWFSLLNAAANLIVDISRSSLVEISTEWFCEHADDRSLRLVNELRV